MVVPARDVLGPDQPGVGGRGRVEIGHHAHQAPERHHAVGVIGPAGLAQRVGREVLAQIGVRQAGIQVVPQHDRLEVQVQRTVFQHQLAVQVARRFDLQAGRETGLVAFLGRCRVERHAVEAFALGEEFVHARQESVRVADAADFEVVAGEHDAQVLGAPFLVLAAGRHDEPQLPVLLAGPVQVVHGYDRMINSTDSGGHFHSCSCAGGCPSVWLRLYY